MSEKVRSIRLPEYVWEALDRDAERCRRSSQKQIEAILVSFYEIEDVEISPLKLEMVGQLLPNSRKKMPIIDARNEPKNKKRA